MIYFKKNIKNRIIKQTLDLWSICIAIYEKVIQYFPLKS